MAAARNGPSRSFRHLEVNFVLRVSIFGRKVDRTESIDMTTTPCLVQLHGVSGDRRVSSTSQLLAGRLQLTRMLHEGFGNQDVMGKAGGSVQMRCPAQPEPEQDKACLGARHKAAVQRVVPPSDSSQDRSAFVQHAG